MQVLPINNFSNQNRISGSPCFKHHPDFLELQKKYEVTASNYFRRGGFYGSASEKFADVIDTLKLFFNDNMKTKISMLIGGIAESQEPYSILAVIKSLIGKKEIKNVVDLYTIDLQSKPEEKILKWQSFYDDRWAPRYVPESFVMEKTINYGYKYQNRYRVKPDIYKYLSSVYNNPDKAKWETRIQDEIKNFPDEKFNIISMNNTLGYLIDYKLIMDTVEEIQKKLKPGGVFITDPHITDYHEVFSPDICDEIYPGIYKKKNSNIDMSTSDNMSNKPDLMIQKDGINFFINFR